MPSIRVVRQFVVVVTMLAACGCTATNEPGPAAPDAGRTDATADSSQPRRRVVELTYAFQLVDLPPGAEVRLWVPLPREDTYQRVDLLPADWQQRAKITQDPKYGNHMAFLRLEVPESGQLHVAMPYRIERWEIRQANRDGSVVLSDEQRRVFLSPSSRVPVGGKPLELVRGLKLPDDPYALCRVLYDRVDEHMQYDKSKPGYGEGDVLWACDSRSGNCTDFHSLFISLARSHGVPARFEIGLPLPESRGQGTIEGYHCWASFFVPERGWIPVDISEADKNPQLRDYYFGNLSENRVSFTIGRDLILQPPQQGPPLNYFIYPYAEIDGQPLDGRNVALEFTYRDLES